MSRLDNSHVIRAATGTELSAKSWLTEAPLRMLMNNLHPEVAERPEELVVYAPSAARRVTGKADKIVETLRRLEDDETLLVQSGKPVGVFRTHPDDAGYDIAIDCARKKGLVSCGDLLGDPAPNGRRSELRLCVDHNLLDWYNLSII